MQKPRILIDLLKIQNISTGLGQFSYHLAKNLIKFGSSQFEFKALIPQNFNFDFLKKDQLIHDSNFLRLGLKSVSNIDLWHSFQQFPSIFPPKKIPHLLTIHDLNFIVEKSAFKQLKYMKKIQNNINRASYLNTISKYSADIISNHVNIFDKEINVIYNGAELTLEEPQMPLHFKKGKKPYFICLCEFNEKKNLELTCNLFSRMDLFDLYLVGNNDTAYGKKIKQKIENENLHDRIKLFNVVTEAEKKYLIQHAKALIFPSKAEGFGLPVIECMSMGKPVFLSKLGSLPEIGGTLAFFFDSFDLSYMKSFILESMIFFEQNKVQNELALIRYANNFSWKKAAKKYLNLYAKILK